MIIQVQESTSKYMQNGSYTGTCSLFGLKLRPNRGSNMSAHYHYANTPIYYTAIFHGCKKLFFQMKNCDIFLIFALNIYPTK